jgi:hypothetical protein
MTSTGRARERDTRTRTRTQTQTHTCTYIWKLVDEVGEERSGDVWLEFVQLLADKVGLPKCTADSHG